MRLDLSSGSGPYNTHPLISSALTQLPNLNNLFIFGLNFSSNVCAQVDQISFNVLPISTGPSALGLPAANRSLKRFISPMAVGAIRPWLVVEHPCPDFLHS
jgi:hypothetical protein